MSQFKSPDCNHLSTPGFGAIIKNCSEKNHPDNKNSRENKIFKKCSVVFAARELKLILAPFKNFYITDEAAGKFIMVGMIWIFLNPDHESQCLVIIPVFKICQCQVILGFFS